MPSFNHPIIDVLYRAILGRKPDPSGLATFEELLSRMGVEAGVPQMLEALLSSKEYSERTFNNPEQLLGRLGPAGARRINGKKVAHIVSLGTHCLTSFLLKKFRLKQYSLPFDWLFSSPETVLHCLNDDFSTFLDPQHFVSLREIRPSQEAGADHRHYRDVHQVSHMFAHRDPTTPEDLLYITRTVDRFRRLMRSPEGKLFLMIARPNHEVAKTFPALSQKIRSMTENGAFLCIQLMQPADQPGCHSVRSIQANRNEALYEFTPSSQELGLGFDELLDDLAIMRLASQFEIDLADTVDGVR